MQTMRRGGCLAFGVWRLGFGSAAKMSSHGSASEYPRLTERYFAARGIEADVRLSYGATEAKVPDIVDAIERVEVYNWDGASATVNGSAAGDYIWGNQGSNLFTGLAGDDIVRREQRERSGLHAHASRVNDEDLNHIGAEVVHQVEKVAAHIDGCRQCQHPQSRRPRRARRPVQPVKGERFGLDHETGLPFA